MAWWSTAVLAILGLGLVTASPVSAGGRAPTLTLTASSTVVAVPFDVTVTVRNSGRHAPAYLGLGPYLDVQRIWDSAAS